ncbi:ribosome silencing factor [Borrelia sp. BU AG58]|uniref:ribosome silencing factor n=1 Tax=Borrelia sp. BU AG58 TaxID=2887345 RepID=UPI001E4E65B0|nr:ribosome silencing factor [Borrelia sp. BU AG58]UER68045.1 ribosome silencing factor [Borrelia sp. BU AG58]
MGGMLSIDDVKGLCRVISDFDGIDVLGIDVSSVCNWADFFIIVSCPSFKHMESLYSEGLVNFFDEKGFNYCIQGKGFIYDWTIVSCENLIVHLMSDKARAYYELEKLWSGGRVVYS